VLVRRNYLLGDGFSRDCGVAVGFKGLLHHRGKKLGASNVTVVVTSFDQAVGVDQSSG